MGERTDERSVQEALASLERRLARLEAFVGMDAAGEADRHVQQAQEAPPAPVARVAPPVVPPPLPVLPPRTIETAAAELPRPLPVAGPAAVADYARPAPIAPPQTQLEQTIGLKWAGWVGAVVVVIGAGLGIKFAYDEGWFEILPPVGRLALMSLGGFGLIAAGELVLRRIHRAAAACLFGAGVATLFLVSYAGHAYYRLYEPETAFALMALTTAVGAAVAVRGNMLSIAVLGQIGGNLAPLLLESDRPLLGSFLTYLLALQAVALVLAWWGGPGRWWTLRLMSLATTALWVLSILAGDVDGTGTLLVFCLLYAGLYQAELIVSAARPQAGAAAAVSDERLSLSLSLSVSSPTGLGLVFSTAVTALLTAAVLVLLRDRADSTRGVWVLSLAAVQAILGFLLSRARAAHDPVYHLAVGYRIQAAALVVVAVPVALSGVWVIVGWAALALAYAVAGNLLDLRISRWAGVMVWRLALLYLGWWTVGPLTRDGGLFQIGLPDADAHAVWFRLLGQDLRAYTLLAWMLAIVGHAVAWLIHQEGLRPVDDAGRRFQRLAWVTNTLAGFAFFTASVAGLPPAGATLAILVYAWLLLGVDLLNPRLGLVLQSAVVVVLVTIKWVAVDTLAERLATNWSPLARRPVFNAVMGVGVLISLTMGALYWLRRQTLWDAFTRLPGRGGSPRAGALPVSPAAPALALAGVLTALFAIGLSVEIDRVVEAAGPGATAWPVWQLKHMAWTVLWTICVVGYVALSRRLEPDERFRPGWAKFAEVMLVLVAVKFLLVDTLLFRAAGGAALSTPGVNFQTLTAAVVVGGLVVTGFLVGSSDAPRARSRRAGRGLPALAGFLAVLVVLWGGTLEIDRAFERLIAAGSAAFADPRRAKQVAFSIFWSVFAVGAVLAGFRFRTTGLRYFGLGLFAVTLVKVVVIDMSQVQTGYRVLSFLGLGLLLMGTSVVYGKLSPVLLRDRERDPDRDAPDGTLPPRQEAGAPT